MNGIFISHNSQDKPFARKINKILKDAGGNTWIDEVEIKYGQSLLSKISDGISNADYLIAIISPNSENSHWVKYELEKAVNLQIKDGKPIVIPIIIADGKVPNFLDGKKYLKLRNSDDLESYKNELLLAVGLAKDLKFEPTFSDLEFFCEDITPQPKILHNGKIVFRSPIYRIKVVWKSHYPFNGMKFTRKFYHDDILLREMTDVYDVIWNESEKMESFIENRKGNDLGTYTGRLYIEDKYQCSASFMIVSPDEFLKYTESK